MRQQTRSPKEPAEKVVQDIRRATRKHYSAEEKIRIVLEGLRGEDSIAELCRREGIAQNLYYRPFSPFFPLRARARGERRFQTATAISFLCLAGRQPLVPAAERDADRAAATPTALRSYAVAADGRPGPRSAAMAHAAVRAQENGAL